MKLYFFLLGLLTKCINHDNISDRVVGEIKARFSEGFAT